jgi:Protein of unknown function (DUF2490)
MPHKSTNSFFGRQWGINSHPPSHSGRGTPGLLTINRTTNRNIGYFSKLIYSNKFSTFKLLSRSRLEERWIQNAIGTAVRARTMLRGVFPLPAYPGLALAVYDEIFVNLNTIRQGPEAGFDQNRFFWASTTPFLPTSMWMLAINYRSLIQSIQAWPIRLTISFFYSSSSIYKICYGYQT